MVSFSVSHRFLFVSIAMMLLLGCGRSLDREKIAASIHAGIIQQGGSAVKSVICPENIKPEVGNRFECVGVLNSGSGFAIAVDQQDEQGNIVWEVSSVKGLLNIVKLQSEVEEALKREMGQVNVDCGLSLFRSVKPGEMFECQLQQKAAKSQLEEESSQSEQSRSQPQSTQATQLKTAGTTQAESSKSSDLKPTDIVQVTIQPSGDVNWQRIIKIPPMKVATAETNAEKTKTTAASESTPSATTAPSPAAAKSADDFLNQPGAADDFN